MILEDRAYTHAAVFDKSQLRVARFQVDVNYNACFPYWSLKGVLAERWAHGPVFGAFLDQGNQVTLSPAASEGAVSPPIQAYYGIVASGYNNESATDIREAREQSLAWLSDVIAVLNPRRITRLSVGWFGLYPITDAPHASKLLRERYYTSAVARLTPQDRFPVLHSAADSFLVNGPEQLSVIVGVVGPPHKGLFFAHPSNERDSRWWMGVRVNAAILNEDGIGKSIPELKRLVDQSYNDFNHACMTALPGLVG